MTMAAMSRTPPCSDRVVAPADRIDQPLPMPGQEKIVSVSTAPASSVPTCRPMHGDHRDQRVAQRVQRR